MCSGSLQHLRLQLYPSPSNPGLQEQLYDPKVLIHSASWWHLLSSSKHSSMSTRKVFFAVESTFLHDCCDHSETSSDMETSFELVLKSISAIAVALPDYVAAIAKESGTILGCRLGVHGFNSRDQQNNSQGLKNNWEIQVLLLPFKCTDL